jgi:hypothetical protein
MNEPEQSPDNDVLTAATVALRAVQVSQCVPPELISATVARIGAARLTWASLEERVTSPAVVPPLAEPAAHTYAERNPHMFRILRWSILAAAILLLIGAISLRGISDHSGSAAFGQVAANVKNATSVTLQAHYRRGTGADQTSDSLIAYVQMDRLRLDISTDSFDPKNPPDKILAVDLKNRTGWQIDPAPKTYKTFLLNDDAMKLLGKPLLMLTSMTDKDAQLGDQQAELIGEEMLDGHKTMVYRLLPGEFKLQEWKIEKGNVVKAWVDPETNFPVRLEGDFAELSGQKNIHALYDHFQWNAPLDAKLFKLEPPEGFKKEADE